MADLHVYKIDPDRFVAESPEDAAAQAAEYYRAMGVEPYDSEPDLQPEDKQLTINFEDDFEDGSTRRQTRSCAEWAKRNGRGLLCSTEW
jgi:hypothetical protein